MEAKPYSKATRAAITRYGVAACTTAFEMNKAGWGASGIANEGPGPIRTTRQADAAINAGQEIAEGRKFTASHGTPEPEPVHLFSDQPMPRRGWTIFTVTLEDETELTVSALDAEDARETVERHYPDAVVGDIERQFNR